ncbi:hypothetical protein Spb1_08110 [Planctopirus ephydatiae]|uniref:Uncharacterized protein n=1 Tax=Planctopirus ephydatiae TaxID=2528019 RepID=A0A518GK35_9PLAN|nr:hypothetical protein Spb1_08110 [Planctopirus ephydatiae]
MPAGVATNVLDCSPSHEYFNFLCMLFEFVGGQLNSSKLQYTSGFEIILRSVSYHVGPHPRLF